MNSYQLVPHALLWLLAFSTVSFATEVVHERAVPSARLTQSAPMIQKTIPRTSLPGLTLEQTVAMLQQ